MDYGHPLEFGTFITPANNPPEAAVELAQLSEAARLRPGHLPGPPVPAAVSGHLDADDLGGRADRAHPDRAATCSTCRCARRPCWPRAAASLDLLSGGRFDLGARRRRLLGRDGGDGRARRLTPGEAVDALGEAIDVIRGDLGRGERTPLRLRRRALPRRRRQARARAGARHPDLARRLQAADAAADRPRRRTAGCRRWPTSSRAICPAGNAIIDEAAADGRAGSAGDPPAAQRLRAVRPASGRDSSRAAASSGSSELLPLVARGRRRHLHPRLGRSRRRCSSFARGGRAGAARGGGRRARRRRCRPTGRVRSAAVRGQRRDGIDYDALPASLRTGAVEPGDPAYARVRSTYMRGGAPGLVLQADGSPAEVVEALALRPRRSRRAAGHPQRRARHQRPVHQRRRHRDRPVPDERRSRCSTRRPGGSGSSRARAGRMSPPRWRRTAGR